MSAEPTVVLTNPIHPEALERLQRHARVETAPDASPAALRRAVAQADGLIVRAQLPDDIFEHAPRLRAVVRHGVGLDMIPMAEATRRGIPVANVPGANTAAVVEYCLAAMLTLRRPLAAMDARLRADGWGAARGLADGAGELSGAVCGIVGVGAIGRGVAQAVAGLGMQAIGLTRRPETLPATVTAVDKPTLFARADVVVLCCPLNEETRGLVDQAALAAMKPHALLINVSRGPVVDTPALLRALDADRLGGAALDVHDVQPLPADHPALRSPRLLLTPHVAGITDGSMRRMSTQSVDDTLRLLRGEPPLNPANAVPPISP